MPITSDRGAITGITCKSDGSKPKPASEYQVLQSKYSTEEFWYQLNDIKVKDCSALSSL